MNNDSIHPALVAALANASRGPDEGVHVRRAAGFAPQHPYVADYTKVSPVGPVICRGGGLTPEEAVDAARAEYEHRVTVLAPGDVRDVLRDPAARAQAERRVLGEVFADAEVIELPESLRQLLAGISSADPETS